jgi:hypothetical protein
MVKTQNVAFNLSLTVLISCSPRVPAPTSEFELEAADIRADPATRCKDCFYVSLTNRILPIPSRYVLAAGFDEQRCQRFITLSGHPEFAEALVKSDAGQLRAATGTILLCARDKLLSMINETHVVDSDRLAHLLDDEIRLIELDADRLGHRRDQRVSALFVEDFGVYISDPNPLLAAAMLHFATAYASRLR